MMDKSRYYRLPFLIFFFLSTSNFVKSETGLSDQKQDKLISILENLQLSIKEILTNIGPNTVSSSGSPQSPATSFRSSSTSASVSVSSKSTGGGSRTPFSQRPEPPVDYPSQSPKDEISPTPPGPVGDRDAPPSGRSTGTSPTTPKKYGPGVPFRCAATYAGSYGHEYEKPSLHHASHFGVSGNHDFTPHIIEAKWSAELGWDPAYIVPHQNMSLYPAAKVLSRGQQVYDILQALMGFDNRIRLFRPNLHLERLRRSAARLGLPDFDSNEMTICLKRLILTDASFLPPSYSNGSLEIRAVMIGVDDNLHFKPSDEVVLYVFMNRQTATTLAEITKPQSVFADSQYTRSWTGGIGEFMTSANDASTLLVTQIAVSQGYTDVLWLNSKEELMTSLNDANIFLFIINELGKRELITPPLNGIIIPGIVRQTILEMTRHWNEFDVTERSVSIHELRTLRRQGRLLEMFSSNTMSNIVPIISVYYAPVRSLIRIPTLDQRDPLYLRLNRAIHAIEYGLIVHPWGEIV